jgi:hypothetical protein
MFNEFDFTEDILSDEEVVVKQYKGGLTLKQITKIHGISYGRLYEILNRHKVPFRRYAASASGDRISYMTNEERVNLIKDYEKGMALSLIYSKYNINKHGCYAILDEAQVPRRNQPFLIDIIVPVKRIVRRTKLSNIMKSHLTVGTL